MSVCFLNMTRTCESRCIAYSDKGATTCRLLNTIEKLVPVPTRPSAPPPTVIK